LYAPVDGIKTTATPDGKVFKVPTGATVDVSKSGNVDLDYNGVGDLLKAFHAKYGNVKPPDASWNRLSQSKPR
jgi:hypothetical protein